MLGRFQTRRIWDLVWCANVLLSIHSLLCAGTCSSGETECGDGSCVTQCDFNDDCSDTSDEFECTAYYQCTFEDSLCWWIKRDTEWQRVEASSNPTVYAPSMDHTTNTSDGYFVVVPPVDRGFTFDQYVTLESPDLIKSLHRGLRFWYSINNGASQNFPKLVIQVRKAGSTWNFSDMQTLITLTSGTASGWQEIEVEVPSSFSHEDFVFRVSVTDSLGWLTFSVDGAVAIDDLEIVCDTLDPLVVTFSSESLDFQFNVNESVSGYVHYRWDYGDGSSPVYSVSPVSSHNYTSPGIYNVFIEATLCGQRQGVLLTIIARNRYLTTDTLISGASIVANSSVVATGKPVLFSASVESGSNVSFVFDFGDNTVTGFISNSNVSHVFTNSGIYTVLVNASNTVSVRQAVCTVLVLDEIDGLSLNFTSPNAVGERVEFQVSITAGSNVSMEFYINNVSWAFQYEENGTTIGHIFNHSGVYRGVLKASNLVSNEEISSEITLQVKVGDVTLITPQVAQSGSNILFSVSVAQGTDLTYHWVISLDNQIMTSTDTNEPDIFLTIVGADLYQVYCSVSNFVSQMASAVNSISVQDAVHGVSLYTSNSTVAVGTNITIIVGFDVGSDLTYSFDFGDGDVISNVTTREVTHIFNAQGTYRVTVVAANAISRENASLTLTVQVPVIGLSLDPILPLNVNATATFTAALAGGSDVTVVWDFGDQTNTSYLISFANNSFLQLLHVYGQSGEYTVNVFVSNDLNSQHQSILVFVANLLSNFTIEGPSVVATDVNVTFTILDFDNVIVHHSYTWCVHDSTGLLLHNETCYNHEFVYSFSRPLTFTVKCVLNNRLSTAVAYLQVQAHQKIVGAELMLTPYVAVGTESVATVLISDGSDVLYEFDFGDGDVLVSRVATVTHSFNIQRVFLVFVTLSNPVSQVNVSKSVIVQEAVGGLVISGSRHLVVGRSAVWEGSLSQGSAVSFVWDFGNGTNQTVEASSLDTQSLVVYDQHRNYTVTLYAFNLVSSLSTSIDVIAQVEVDDVHLVAPSVAKRGRTIEMSASAMSGSDIVYHCRGLDENSSIVFEETPIYGVLNVSFHVTGRYTLQCVVYNYVSQVNVSAVVDVYDEISGVILSSNRTVVSTGSAVQLEASASTGSNIAYTFILGNGLAINTTSSRIARVFWYPAVYHVRVILANPVGFVSTSIDIIVQDEALELRLAADRRTLTVNESVTFTASYATGTNVSLMFISGDGISSVETQLQGNNVSWMHSYRRPGWYHVMVTAENLVSSLSRSLVVVVEEQVMGLVLTGPDVVETKKNVTFTAEVDKGSSLNYRWTIERTNGGSVADLDINETVVTWMFETAGVYDVSVSVGNEVSSAHSHYRVVAQDKIEALALIRLTNVVSVGQTMRLLISIEKGTNASLFVNFGENTTNSRRVIQAGLTYELFHVYRSVGEYIYAVTVENLVSLVSQSGMVSVEEAVAGLVLAGPHFTKTGTYANFTASVDEGTSITFTWMITNQREMRVAYLEESEISEFPWQFQTDGIYNVSVVAKNAGNSDAASHLIIVQDSVGQLALVGPIAATSVGRAVSFYISIQNGTNVTLYVYFGDGIFEVLRQSPGGQIVELTHVYVTAGRYVCSVHAENLVSSSPVKTTVVTVQQPIGALSLNAFPLGMEGSDPTVFFRVNTTIVLLLSLSLGSDLEYLWKMGDSNVTQTTSTALITHSYSVPGTYNVTVEVRNNVSSAIARLSLFIEEPVVNMSVQTPERIVSGGKTEIKVTASTDATHVTCFIDFGDGKRAILTKLEPSHSVGSRFLLCEVNHTYPIPGTYKLRTVVSNHVSSYEETMRIVVTVSCSNPYMRISSKLEVDPLVGSYEIARSDNFELISQMSVECNGLVKAEYKWTVARLGYNHSTVELPSSVITDTETFYLRGGTLSYGLYEMNVTVSFPNVANDYTTTLSVRVDVKAADLRASIAGGSRRSVHADRDVILDAESGSYDPDNLSDESLIYEWSCALIENSNNDTVDCDPNVDRRSSLTCLRSVPLPPQGRGRLELSAGTLRPNTTYLFKVTVKKDRRASAACKVLIVSAAAIPDAFIKCVRNCQSSVNPSYDLVLVGECINCTIDETFTTIGYFWSLLRDGEEIDFDWDELTTTNRTQAGLVIKAGTFNPDEAYTLRLTVTAGNGPPGSADFDFTTSSAPRGGTCSVTPTIGYALNTTFTITCSNWTDDSGPVDYYFYYGTGRYVNVAGGEASNLHLESTGSQSLEVNGLFLCSYGTDRSAVLPYLPSGPSFENYTISVVIRITNVHHVSTTFRTEIMVLDAVESGGELLDMMSGIMLVNDSLMDRMTSFGQLRNMVQLCNSIAVTMNKQADEEIERHSIKIEENRERREEMRSKIVASLAAVTPSSLEEVTQVASAVEASTRQTDELSIDSQLVLASTIKVIAKKLKAHAELDESNDNRVVESTAADILASLSRTLKASVDAATIPDVSILDYSLIVNGSTAQNRRRKRRALTTSIDQVVEDRQVATDTLQAADTLSQAVLVSKIVGEEETTLHGSGLIMVLQRRAVEQSCGSGRATVYGDSNVAFVLPPTADVLHCEANVSQVDVQMMSSVENVHTWDPSAKNVSSSSGSLAVFDSDYNRIVVSNLSQYIHMFIRSEDSNSTLNLSTANQTYTIGCLQTGIHGVDLTLESSSLLVTVERENEDDNQSLTVLVKYASYPTLENYDFRYTLPLPDDYLIDLRISNEDVGKTLERSKDFFTSLSPYTVFIPSSLLTNGSGEYYVGIRMDFNGSANSQCVGNMNVSYKFYARAPTCLFWDDNLETWRSNGCKAGPYSSSDQLHCLCNHLTFFGGSLLAPPNSINFISDAVAFAAISDNPVAFSLVMSIYGLYLLLAVFAYRADRRDSKEAEIIVLTDNLFHGEYLYEVTIATGLRRNAGTSSNVGIILVGGEGSSDPRLLQADGRKLFARGSVDVFRLTNYHSLGQLKGVQVWHDGAGGDSGWFLDRVRVRDMKTGDVWLCLCGRWLDTKRGDGRTGRFVPVATGEELKSFTHLFPYKSARGFTDSHIWFSLFTRPPTSHFTRLQRLSCCFCLLLCYMCASALWYGAVDEASTATANQSLGPFQFTWAEIYTGVMTSLIVFPINVLIVQIFRLAAPKTKKNNCFTCCRSRYSTRSKRRVSLGPTFKQKLFAVASRPMSPNLSIFSSRVSPVADDSDVRLLLSRDGSSTSIDRFVAWNNDDDSLTTSRSQSPLSTTTTTTDDSVFADEKSKKHRICCFKLRLPHCFVYVAWFLLVACSALASYVTILLGYTFGTAKATEWVHAFIISTIQSIFVTQPFKVIGFAVFYAIIIKRAEIDGEVDVDTADLVLSKTDGAATDPRHFQPPSRQSNFDQSVRAARRKLRKKEGTFRAIKDLVIYALFLTILWMIAYTDRTPDMYHMTTAVKNIVLNAKGRSGITFSNVNRASDFWRWTETTLLSGLYGQNWYNGEPLEEGFTAEPYLKLVGKPRLKQFRVEKGSCGVADLFADEITRCYDSYSNDAADCGDYLPEWLPTTRSNVSQDGWRYSSSNTWLIWGQTGTYTGGGYVVELDRNNRSIADATIVALKDGRWIEHGTRAVTVQFTVYNANSNLFSIGLLLVEFPASGGALTSSTIYTTRLFRYVTYFQLFIVACEAVFVLFLLYYTVRAVRGIRKEKAAFFTEPWNWVEIVVIMLGWTTTGVYIARLLYVLQASDTFQSNPNQYVEFYHIVLLDIIYLTGWSLLVFFSFLKILRLLQFNRRMLLLAGTLRTAGMQLVAFGIAMIIVMVAFASLHMGLFGDIDYRFSSFSTTLQYQIEMILGKFSAKQIRENHPIVGPIAFAVFAMTGVVFLSNLFVVLISETFSIVKRDNDQMQNKYEVVEYLKELVGLGDDDDEEKETANGCDDDDDDYILGSKAPSPEVMETMYAALQGKVDFILERFIQIEVMMERQEMDCLLEDLEDVLHVERNI